MPKLNELHSKYKDQGLVLIGVHSTRGSEKMAAFAKEHAITYPLAVDLDSATKTAFLVDGHPDYHIIDRAGNLRVADCKNADVARVVEILLKEKAPSAMHPALADAATTAKKKNKRIAVLFGSDAKRDAVQKAWGKGRSNYGFLYNEYEVVGLTADAHPDLAQMDGSAADGIAMAIFDFNGTELYRGAVDEGNPEAAYKMLETHRIPEANAEALLAGALARATKENKRVLVHLGAPT